MSVNLGETKVSDILKTVSGGGTSNYNNLANKPQINGVELVGNKTAEELGIKQGVTEEVLTQALAAETASREKQDELLQGEIDNKLSPHNIVAGENVEIIQDGGNVTISAQNSPIATLESAGIVRPDGETISVDSEGIIRAVSGGEAIHVIRNNAEEPFILENNELGYYLLDLDSLGTTFLCFQEIQRCFSMERLKIGSLLARLRKKQLLYYLIIIQILKKAKVKVKFLY